MQISIKSDDDIVTMRFRGSSGTLAVGLGALTCEVIEKTGMTGADLLGSIAIMLGKRDSTSGGDGNSYLDIVAFIRSHGASPMEDLQELWKRIMFNMAVSNTDDHLRNHGFY